MSLATPDLGTLAIELTPELRNPCALKGRLPAEPDIVSTGEWVVIGVNATSDWACERTRADGLVQVIDRYNARLKGRTSDAPGPKAPVRKEPAIADRRRLVS